MQEFAMAIPSLNTASYSADSLPTALAPTAARWFFFFLLSVQQAAEHPLTWPRQDMELSYNPVDLKV